MKKFYLLTKTLLVAMLLCVGASNVWADWTETYSQDFEDDKTYNVLESYDGTRATVSQQSRTVDESTSKYMKVVSAGNGTTVNYIKFAASSVYTGSSKYKIEFDFGMTCIRNSSSQTQEFSIQDGSGNKLIRFQNTTSSNSTSSTANVFLGTSGDASGTIAIQNSYSANPNTFYHATIEASDEGTTITLDDGVNTPTEYKLSNDFVKVTKFAYQTGKTYGAWAIDNMTVSVFLDSEVISTPSIAVAYAGANRTVTITPGASSESNPVTTYYTLDGEDPTSSSSVYSTPLDIDENCTVKAISISSSDVASDIASQAVTVGKLKLATPTLTKTGYSDGSYTVTISSVQSGLPYPPASATLYYSVNGGDATAYSSPFSVAAGSTVTGYVTATNYTNSDNANLTTAVRPTLSEVWSIDFAGQATQDKGGVTVGSEAFTANGTSFGNITADSYTSNDNFGVKTGSSWLLRNTGAKGLYSQNGSGTPVGVAGLTKGQYVRMVVSSMTSCSVSGAASLVNDMSTPTELFIVANEDGNANINFNRYVYIKSIAVCDEMTPVQINKATIIANKGDITSMINSDFEANADGWTGGNRTTGLARSWKSGSVANPFYETTSAGTMSYTLSDMPAGTYKVVAAWRSISGGTMTPSIAGTNGSTVTGTGDAAPAVGTKEINLNGVEMPYSDLGGFTTNSLGHNWHWITATGILAADGDLVISFTTAGTNGWNAIDDVHLYCTELDETSYCTSVTEGSAVSNSGGKVVTCDIVLNNPNSIISSDETITTAAGATLNNNLVGDNIAQLIIYDGYSFSMAAGDYTINNSYGAAKYYRQFTKDQYCTICLPFTPAIGTGTYYEPTSFAGDVLSFSAVADKDLKPNTPYILKPSGSYKDLWNNNNGDNAEKYNVKYENAQPATEISDGAMWFTGRYVQTEVQGEWTGDYYVMGTDNNLHKISDTGSVTVNPFRAYFYVSEGSSLARTIRVVFGDVTGVDSVEASATAKAKDGKFIENGKLVIVKNGKKYNANGTQVK